MSTIEEKRREMSKAALRRDVSTYQRLKYEIALLESGNGDLLQPDVALVRLQEETSPLLKIAESDKEAIELNHALTPIGDYSIEGPTDDEEGSPIGADVPFIPVPIPIPIEAIPIPESLEAPSLTLEDHTIIHEGVSRDSAAPKSGLQGLEATFQVESFDEIAAALAAKDSPQVTNQPEEIDDASLYPPGKVEASSLISVVSTEESILTPPIANTGPDCPQSIEELGMDSSAAYVDSLTREESQLAASPGLPVTEIKGSIVEGAKRICNHCQHEFIGEIPWSAYVDETGDGPVPRCEFCGIGRIMTIVGDAVKSPKCYHKCPKCFKTWTHDLVPSDVDVLHGCKIFTQEDAICSSCERIREEIRAEFLRVETHRSEIKAMNAPMDKNQLFFMVDEENRSKDLSNEEIESRIKEMDLMAAEAIGRSKGIRKVRAMKFDSLDAAEKQRMRQEWKEVGQLVNSEKIKKAREKKESTEIDKQEKGIQGAMLAFNMSRDEAEKWLWENKKK